MRLFLTSFSNSIAELATERKRSGKQAVHLSRMQKELADLGSILQDGKHLKEVVGRLCKKYLKSGSDAASGLGPGKTRSYLFLGAQKLD